MTPPRRLLLDLTEVREIVLHREDPDWNRAWQRVELLARMGSTVARNMSSRWPGSRYPVVRRAADRALVELEAHPSRREVQAPPSIDLALVVIATCWDHTLDPDEAQRFLRRRTKAARSAEQRRRREIAKGRAKVAAWSARP